MGNDSHRDGNYSGISIFLPDDRKWYDEYEDEYYTLDFAALHWDDFLETSMAQTEEVDI